VNFLDLLVILAAVAAGWFGYRLGFVTRVLSWAGLALGVLVAVLFVDDIASEFKSAEPRARLLAALAFVFIAATAGQALGYAAGVALRRRIGRRAGPTLHRADRVAGTVVGVFGVLAVLWLLIPALASSPGWPARAVRESALARAIDRFAPTPPQSSATLGRIVGDESFPEVFDTLTSPDAGPAPTAGIPADAAQRVEASVVKVTGVACDREQDGTGFVVGRDLLVTNAHVIAGEGRTRVDTQDGRELTTQLVAFDANRDLAVLRVPDLGITPLTRATGHVNDVGALFGHAEGGPLRQAPMRIAEQIVARGTNIERTAETQRDVFVLAAHAAPGDSGAPIVDRQGHVLGVLFAIDVSRDSTAYALTGRELAAVVDPVLAGAAPPPTGTGPCLAG
jgi:S1-C subfamily serine protease